MKIVDSDHFVRVEQVEDWADFEEFCSGCGAVVFRGQSDSSWDLSTNYERTFSHTSAKGINQSRESAMLHRCVAEGHLYIENPPDEKDFVSWLAEMQHYGASTRLLDVTRSKYIALFFALVDMKSGKDGAVWAFDIPRSDNFFENLLVERFPHVEVERDAFEPNDGILPYEDIGWKIANAAIGCEPAGKITSLPASLTTKPEEGEKWLALLNDCYKSGMVVHVLPKRMNRRLLAQQGEFLFPFNIRHTFVQNLLGPIGGSDFSGELCAFGDADTREKAKTTVTPRVIKAIIPHIRRDDFLDRLMEMNVSYRTLFPDVYGFMKSLQYQRDRNRIGLQLINDKQKGLVLRINDFER